MEYYTTEDIESTLHIELKHLEPKGIVEQVDSN